jgi:hypothetical protein
MQQNFSSTKLPTVGASSAIGGASAWSNPMNITADDGSSASWAAFEGGQMSEIVGSVFDFQDLPPSAVIDGVEVTIDGGVSSTYGSVNLNISGAVSKDAGGLSTSYGGASDLWGLDEITEADIQSLAVNVFIGDQSGGDASASIDYLSVTVFWHIEVPSVPTDVPTRFAHKMYSRDGNFLGELPNVTSKVGFAQDINSAGSSIVVTCGEFVTNEVIVEPLLTEGGDTILTESDLPILTTSTNLQVVTGDSTDEAIFKNSNRLKIWMYNKYYPNGKIVFSGQVNRVEFKYGGGDASVKLTVYSDGLDLNNFVARGYPFAYTNDVVQTTQNGYVTVSGVGPGWERYGQSFLTGGAITNVGSIDLMLQGTADVTVSLFDGVFNNFLGSITKSVAVGSATVVPFDFSQLLEVASAGVHSFNVAVAGGQTIRLYRNSTSVYADGTMYNSSYAGGGGGSYEAVAGDLYFVTKWGVPTTTTTYTADDPVTEMASGILLDYNARGGLITERDFEATGLSLTYTFVMAFIYDAIKKILELCPTGFYSYIDLGTAEIDIKQMSDTADYTVVRGRHINELNLALTIEQVKNYLLLSGGDTGGGTNLYRQYQDTESSAYYGIRTVPKSDNRVTLDATADAIGDSFIVENSDEAQQTSLSVLNDHIDISLLTPGKTIGFGNFGNFIDDMVLQIVRREINFSDGIVILTLGRLPVRMSDEVQRINRGLLNEQTINNPTSPS